MATTREATVCEHAAWLHRWLGRESDGATGRYDEIGDWFRMETGIDRPGRSVPLECYAAPDEERERAFAAWCREKQTEARVRAEAMARMLGAIDLEVHDDD